jgi:hypothetical protein
MGWAAHVIGGDCGHDNCLNSLNLFDKMNVISVQKQLNVSVDKSVNFDKNKPSSSDTLGLLGLASPIMMIIG